MNRRFLIPNPFVGMSRREHARAVAAGVVSAAAELGARTAGGRSKATYSRTLAGELRRANPEVIYYLRKVIAAKHGAIGSQLQKRRKAK